MSATTYLVGGSGNRLAADVSGPEDAPVVFLLHGGGQTRHSWQRAHHALAKSGYRVISVDARGHGESEWIAEGDYSLEAQVADLLALVESVGGRPALVGASMGGVNSLIACGQHEELASVLVLVDVTPKLETAGVEHIHRFMSGNPDGFASLQEAAEAIAAYNPSRPKPTNLDGLSKNLRLLDDGRWHWHWDPKFILGDRHLKIAHIGETMLKAAGNVKIPTLLVRGKQSDVVSMDGVRQLQALIPSMEFVDVEGAGHMVAGDKNDKFNTAIIDFLYRHYPTHRP
jgi:pimeloyl-ACP methyl ester carboxylesterase